jgi:hypothetical protein
MLARRDRRFTAWLRFACPGFTDFAPHLLHIECSLPNTDTSPLAAAAGLTAEGCSDSSPHFQQVRSVYVFTVVAVMAGPRGLISLRRATLDQNIHRERVPAAFRTACPLGGGATRYALFVMRVGLNARAAERVSWSAHSSRQERTVGRGLDNRQQVKNPKKRERYTEPKKGGATRVTAKQRRDRLERRKKVITGDKRD